MEKIATTQFKSPLVRETSYGSTPMGEHFNEMTLYREGDRGRIIWNFGKEAADEDEIEIGLWFDGGLVDDYDGVFSLPKQAVELLKSVGYTVEEESE